ncbi:MAG: helix-turn-helix domain-containing protein [Candidatus Brocadiae bacterium]|nr:helix-turn-helix domain-containing protein [Candidatus Brocadiia bacterium]
MCSVEKEKTSEKLMTLSEVAGYLQIKERTIYQWAQKGTIPSFKLGNVWRFERKDIESWIESRKKDTLRPKKGK